MSQLNGRSLSISLKAHLVHSKVWISLDILLTLGSFDQYRAQ